MRKIHNDRIKPAKLPIEHRPAVRRDLEIAWDPVSMSELPGLRFEYAEAQLQPLTERLHKEALSWVLGNA